MCAPRPAAVGGKRQLEGEARAVANAQVDAAHHCGGGERAQVDAAAMSDRRH
jgi:hypothetical protein